MTKKDTLILQGKELRKLHDIEGVGLVALAKIKGVSRSTMQKVFAELGIKAVMGKGGPPRLHKDKVEQNIENIQKLYLVDKLYCTQIAKIYNVPPDSIWRALSKIKCPIRKYKYSCNENYFETIDTPDKAYFLGLLYADGYNKTTQGFTITLQEEDRDILEKFKKYIEFEGNLYHKTVENRKPTYELNIGNKKLSEDLIRVGCGPCKSLTLQFPTEEQVPKYLLSHFIRGYLDGDGCVSIEKRSCSTKIVLCLTEQFGVELQKILNEKFNIHSLITKQSKIHVLSMGGRLQCVKFLDWLYQDAEELKLQRKYEKYLLAKSYQPKRTRIDGPLK